MPIGAASEREVLLSDVVSETVLAEATRLASGDASKATHWYFNAPLREFGGQTAAALVKQGRGPELLKVLDSYQQGPVG